jgi:trk system potassium uptake protein TrkH
MVAPIVHPSSSFGAVFHILSMLVMLFSLTFSVPLSFGFFDQDAAKDAFVLGGWITFSTGLVGFFLTKRHRRELQPRDGFLLVGLVWITLAFFAALPLWFFLKELDFTHAFFETISALTTTGATALSGLDQMPRSILIWRSLLQWFGGMGILVLAVAILPLLGVGGMQIYRAETPGPMKESKLTPRIAETAKGFWGLYVLFTTACFLAYWAAGMNWFDAVVHAGTTMSIGGLSSYDASIGHFQNPMIELVAIVFMMVAGVNFAVHFSAIRRMTVTPYRQCPEARYFVLAIGVSVLVVAAMLWARGVYADPLQALRHAAFNVVSIGTTTGYATQDYANWPAFAPWLMVLLSAFATSSNSTGGGIKMIRLVIMAKLAKQELQRIIHPRSVNPVQLDQSSVSQTVIFSILAFMLFYGATVMVATFLLLLSGMHDVTAISAVLACINNLGPGLGDVGPAANYGALTNFQLWVLSATMLLGRLELLTLIVVVAPAFWRK